MARLTPTETFGRFPSFRPSRLTSYNVCQAGDRDVKRREFITLVGEAAAWLVRSSVQQAPGLPVVAGADSS